MPKAKQLSIPLGEDAPAFWQLHRYFRITWPQQKDLGKGAGVRFGLEPASEVVVGIG